MRKKYAPRTALSDERRLFAEMRPPAENAGLFAGAAEAELAGLAIGGALARTKSTG
jgi:hypothetical protein